MLELAVAGRAAAMLVLLSMPVPVSEAVVGLLLALGSKVNPAEPTIVLKVDPSVDPCTDRVSVRALQAVAGGSLRTTLPMQVPTCRTVISSIGTGKVLLEFDLRETYGRQEEIRFRRSILCSQGVGSEE